jgi:hypothetical protein
MGIGLAIQKVMRDVTGVDGLNEHIAALLGGQTRSPAQVGQKGIAQGPAFARQWAMGVTNFIGAGWTAVGLGHQASQNVDARTAQTLGVVQGHFDAMAKFFFLPWLASAATLTRLPSARHTSPLKATRWRVEQHLFQAMGLQARVNFAGFELVGRHVLHAFETIAGSGFKSR